MSSLRLLVGDVRQRLRDLPSDCFQTVVTSPPYWNHRQYSTAPQTWGGDSNCEHLWCHSRYYTEKSAGGSSSEAFSEAGPANAARLKAARWREDDTCTRCGCWRGELGAEPTIQQYVANIVEVFREVRRVLRFDGLVFLNLGDGYCSQGGHTRYGSNSQRNGRSDEAAANGVKGLPAGSGLKNKDLCMVPARVAIALVDDGWYLRNDVIWHRKNAKPESVRDRFSMDYEHVFMLARSPKYYFDQDAVREAHATPIKDQARQRNTRGKQAYAGAGVGQPMQDAYAGLGFGVGGRNRRSVWSINTTPYPGAHFACFPEALVEIPLRAATSEGGACIKCGSPRVRVTVKGNPDREWQAACGGSAVNGTYNGQATKDFAAAGAEDASAVKARILEGMRPKLTLGFAFTCTCWGTPRTKFPEARCDRKRHQRTVSGDHRRRVVRYLTAPEGTTAPCRVLDPFCGSGTMLAVAHQLGLDAVGIELQESYVPLCEERVEKVSGTLVVERNFAPMKLAPVIEGPSLEAHQGPFDDLECWEIPETWLMARRDESPEIVALLAAAASHLCLLREVEWEIEEPIDEDTPGWIEEETVPPFAWTGDRG